MRLPGRLPASGGLTFCFVIAFSAIVSIFSGLIGVQFITSCVPQDLRQSSGSAFRAAAAKQRDSQLLKQDTPLVEHDSPLIATAKLIAAWQNGAVAFVAGNYAMNDMMENWARAANRVHPPLGYIILPLDKNGYDDLIRRNVSGVVRDEVAWARFSADVSAYESTEFVSMSTYKWQSVHAILKAGVNVLMTDPDCVFMRNPMPYLSTIANCDVFPQVDLNYAATGLTVREKGGFVYDEPPENKHIIRANGGLGFFRSTPATISILDSYFARMYSQEESKRDNDQENWNLCGWGWASLNGLPAGQSMGPFIADTMLAGDCIRYTPKSSSKLVKTDLMLAPLSPSLFMSYPSYATHRSRDLERPYVLHFNWILGVDKKIAAMKQTELWFLKS